MTSNKNTTPSKRTQVRFGKLKERMGAIKARILGLNPVLLIAFAIGLIVVVALMRIPIWLQSASALPLKDRLQIENEIFRTVAQVFGGVVVIAGAYSAWRNLKAVEKNINISQEGQITNRFSNAIEHLSSDKLIEKLGGIYALERIARDSERDHQTIIEVLTAYIRENAKFINDGDSTLISLEILRKMIPYGTPVQFTDIIGAYMEGLPDEKGKVREKYCWVIGENEKTRKPIAADIAAAIQVLSRRNHQFDRPGQKIGLSKTDLMRAGFSQASLAGAFFLRSHLEGSFFDGTNLERANFSESNLRGAFFYQANLKKASLEKANAQGAIFSQADMEGANLTLAQLDGAILSGANLKNAKLMGASMVDTWMEGTNFEDADLRGVRGLTDEQIASAITNENTKLPPLTKPESSSSQVGSNASIDADNKAE